MLMMVGIVGCGPAYLSYDNEIVVSIPSSFAEYMPYEKEELPKFVYQFDGTRTVAGYSKDNLFILTKNDDLIISEEIKDILSNYTEDSLITRKSEQAAETNTALLGGQKFPIIEPSYEYWHILFLEDGSRLSIEYRKFTSNNVDYYGWTYANGITMRLEIPLMVREEMINQELTKVLYMIPLPYHVKYEISTNIDLKRVLSNSDYRTNNSWYTFSYPEDIESSMSKIEKVEYVKQWYDKYCNGRQEGNDYIVSYLGYNFIINFDAIKVHKTLNVDTDAFEISFLGKTE